MNTPLLLRLTGTFLLTMAAFGCGEEEPKAQAPSLIFKFPISAQAVSSSGDPIPGVSVLMTLGKGEDVETKVIGYTDKNGEFKALVEAQHETPIVIGLNAPEKYSFVSGTDLLEDQLKAKRDEKDKTLVHTNTLSVKATYQSKEVEHLVWVKLDCPTKKKSSDTLCQDVQIKQDGEILATTDYQGRAHFTLTALPTEDVRLTINNNVILSEEDGSAVQLDPPMPGFTLPASRTPQAYVIEQTFSMPEEVEEKPEPKKPAAKKKRRRKKTRKKATKKKSSVSFSKKKTTTKKKKTTSKPKKNDNGISLF